MTTPLQIADLFCGAGGTSTGAALAAQRIGRPARITAVNHWPIAVETHAKNHPDARHLCADLDSLDPRRLYREGELDLLCASPECTHHSRARGGKPMSDQSRATAHCVVRWADALRPREILVENVPEFAEWGPLDAHNKPIPERKGAIFRAWVGMLESLGYRVAWSVLNCADHGDATTRRRLFVRASLSGAPAWPDPSHCESGKGDLFGGRRPWRGADQIIDWSIPLPSIYSRKKPLAENTLRRIREGLERYGNGCLVAMEHGGRALDLAKPVPTITTAKGGAFGVAYLLGQQSGARLRPATLPVPTISASGAISLIVEYYGNGVARPTSQPLPTVTCRDRFALIRAQGGDIGFRMLRPHELAAAMSFPPGYQFAGTQEQAVRQIGNAVPVSTAAALAQAALSPRLTHLSQ